MGSVKNRGKKPLRKLATFWRDKNEFCQNERCPNDHEIAVSIFRGTGYCSDNCKKALGLDGVTHGAR